MAGPKRDACRRDVFQQSLAPAVHRADLADECDLIRALRLPRWLDMLHRNARQPGAIGETRRHEPMQVVAIIHGRNRIERLCPRVVDHGTDRSLHMVGVTADQQPGTTKGAQVDRHVRTQCAAPDDDEVRAFPRRPPDASWPQGRRRHRPAQNDRAGRRRQRDYWLRVSHPMVN